MPNALAMRRLILRSNLVGRSKGNCPFTITVHYVVRKGLVLMAQRGLRATIGGDETELALALHGRRLIDAFLNLKNDKLRGAVADLAHVLAGKN